MDNYRLAAKKGHTARSPLFGSRAWRESFDTIANSKAGELAKLPSIADTWQAAHPRAIRIARPFGEAKIKTRSPNFLITRGDLRSFKRDYSLSYIDLGHIFGIPTRKLNKWLAPNKNDADLLPIEAELFDLKVQKYLSRKA